MKAFLPRMKAPLSANIFVLALLLFSLAGCSYSEGDSADINLKMGNPSHATASIWHKNNFLMEKEYFTLSYNNDKGTPNWVSWYLDKSYLGDAPRFPFHPDKTLPGGFHRITPGDYTSSGFERGHMCPHSDRSATPEMSRETFAMSNIIPQSPHVNEKAWAQLEMYCRDLVQFHNKVLYIISGPAGQGGTGSEGQRNIIGKRLKVVVPAQCWKVIMVLDAGQGDDIQKVNENTRLIAVIMPNDTTVAENWAKFRVSVNDVEKLTGYTFFNKAPANIIAPLKAKVDDEYIPRPKPIHHKGSHAK